MTQVNGQLNGQLNQSLEEPNSNQIETKKIRISIVDDSGVIREGLRIMLEIEPGFEIVGMANDGKAAIELVEAQRPDIVLMDMEMPELNGISTTQIINERFPDTKVVVFSDHAENSYITQSLEAGAKGYFQKKTAITEVTQGIKNVHKGLYQFGPSLLENYISHTARLTAQSDFSSDSLLLPKTKPETFSVPVKAEPPSELELKPYIDEDESAAPPWLKLIIAVIILSSFALAITAMAIAKFKPALFSQIVGNPPPTSVTPAPVPTPTAVSALGKIEPEGEIVQLSVSAAAEGSRVDRLFVERGDKVKQGQLVAILDSYNPANAALNKAQSDVRVAQANLARVQAGAKQGDISAQISAINGVKAELRGQIAAQKAAIARLTAELSNAQVEYNRHQQLFKDGAITAQARDTKRLRVDTVGQQLAEARETLNRTIETTNDRHNEAQAKLESIAEVRPVDLQVAQAELEQSQAVVQQAEADLALAEVRSPIDGQVLNVNTRPGEVVDNKEGIIALGQTEQMYVVAEVYETDVDKVRLGQKAIVTGSTIEKELTGKVAQVGLEVEQQDVFESDPLVNTDNKVVEVKIRLSPESSKQVVTLSNLQVQVVIDL
jgi:HlyD family secretion protein